MSDDGIKYKAREHYGVCVYDARALFVSSDTWPKKSWINLHGLQYASREHQFPNEIKDEP